MLKIKRVYNDPEQGDGFRILVDRLWPRGLTKEKARVDLWIREIGPSDALRTWFAHDPGKWDEFKRRYFEELEGKKPQIGQIAQAMQRGSVTLLYGTKEERYNNAAALEEFIESRVLVKS